MSMFNVGRRDGIEDRELMDDFQMSQKPDDYRDGYVLGRGESAAVRQSSHLAGAIAVGEAAFRYGMSKEKAIALYGAKSDDGSKAALEQSYELEQEMAAQRAEEEGI